MNYSTINVKSYRSSDEALSELERELNVRTRCFPTWIEQGKVNRIDAQDRLDRLASAFEIVSAIVKHHAVEFDTMLQKKNVQPVDGAAPDPLA